MEGRRGEVLGARDGMSDAAAGDLFADDFYAVLYLETQREAYLLLYSQFILAFYFLHT